MSIEVAQIGIAVFAAGLLLWIAVTSSKSER